jgi:hypothetical protein
MKNGKLFKFEYVVGKSRTREGAESVAQRVNETLQAASPHQHATVTTIANGQGVYGYRVNVVSEVK